MCFCLWQLFGGAELRDPELVPERISLGSDVSAGATLSRVQLSAVTSLLVQLSAVTSLLVQFSAVTSLLVQLSAVTSLLVQLSAVIYLLVQSSTVLETDSCREMTYIMHCSRYMVTPASHCHFPAKISCAHSPFE